MKTGWEGSPELCPGQFLAVPCSPDPEEAHAGVANDFMAADRDLLMVLLNHHESCCDKPRMAGETTVAMTAVALITGMRNYLLHQAF